MWSVGKNNPLEKTSSDSGFTLLELLVVLGIMGLIYGLAVPIYSKFLPSVTLNSTAEEVVSDLRRSRLKAILSGKPVTFILQENGEGYSLPDLKIDKQTKGVDLSFQGKERQKIIFTPDGKNGGFILVLTTGETESQRIRKITSDWITGRISMVDTER
jgi:general secretion pathway protein H